MSPLVPFGSPFPPVLFILCDAPYPLLILHRTSYPLRSQVKELEDDGPQEVGFHDALEAAAGRGLKRARGEQGEVDDPAAIAQEHEPHRMHGTRSITDDIENAAP